MSRKDRFQFDLIVPIRCHKWIALAMQQLRYKPSIPCMVYGHAKISYSVTFHMRLNAYEILPDVDNNPAADHQVTTAEQDTSLYSQRSISIAVICIHLFLLWRKLLSKWTRWLRDASHKPVLLLLLHFALLPGFSVRIRTRVVN